MGKQRIILIACFICLSVNLFAQRVHIDQSFGLSASTADIHGKAKLVTDSSVTDSDYKLTLRQYGIVYFPRVDLVQWKNGSVSIGSAFMLGFSTTHKYTSTDFNGTRDTAIAGVNGAYLAFTIPLNMDINFGLHSAQDESRKSFGFYAGAGYSYNYTKIKTSIGRFPYDGFDPVFRAGIRLGASWQNRCDIGFSIRGALRNNPMRIYELHILKDL